MSAIDRVRRIVSLVSLRAVGALALSTVFVLMLSGCVRFSSLLKTNWSENYALPEAGTESSHPELTDGKVSTVAETPPKADPREFIIRFDRVRRVRRIRVVNDNLYRFNIAYWDLTRQEWRTIKTIWQRRNVTGADRIIQPVYDINQINFETDQIKIIVTRTVDDLIVNKVVPARDDKVLDHVQRVIGGTWVEYYRVIVESPARIREVEIYGIDPSRG